MNRQRPAASASPRALIGQLRALGNVQAPVMLLPRVMIRLGLGDAYFSLDTPLGPIFVAYNDLGVSAVMRASETSEFEAAFRARFGRMVYRLAEPPATLVRALTRHLHGKTRSDPHFDLRGLTAFERAVLLKALEIPRGEVRPYAWVAREIGHPKAVRAVGSALADNPIPLLIPCHRVVRSDGHIGEYGLGGSAAKRTILKAEGVDADQLEALARSGVRYVGSDTTYVYCFPTCRYARRITDQHRVLFHSEAEAAAAGYRPCTTCRPAVV
jgi:O-6-methylguanine DNA methyltransferase